MPSILDKIRSALKRPTTTSAQLADALADALKADADARSAVERQVEAVAAGYLDDNVQRAAARSKLADLRADAEDATAVLAEVERRHAAALAVDEQGRRCALYDAAKAEADTAALALAKTYPTLARGLVAMLKDLATAQQAVALANSQLPDGALPLVDPEMAARAVPASAREIISEEDVALWSRLDMETPVDAAFQAAIYSLDKADGTPSGWGKRPDDHEACFRLRRFRKVTYHEPTNGDWPLPIAAALQLPAVRGKGMLWGDSHPVYTPGLSMTLIGQAEPAAVLARLAEADAAAVARPVKVERPAKVEWTWLGEAVATPDKPVAINTMRRGQPAGTGSRFGASPFAAPGARAPSAGGRR